MKRILITGITGFVGTNLVRFFYGGPDVVLFGHSRDAVKAGEIFKGMNIKFINHLTAETIDEFDVDTIIHTAGIAHDLSNVYTTDDYYRVNFKHTTALYMQFLASNADRFIFLSSIKALSDGSHLPLTESMLAAPSTHYGKSKRMAEEFLLQQAPGGKRLYILRPCMIHGPGNKGNLNLLYRYVKSGLPYPLAAFDNSRSFLSIGNLCFIVKELIEQKISPGIYHISDTKPLSTRDLVQLIGRALGRRVWMLSIPRRAITTLFAIVGKSAMLHKLTENMVVSNEKIILAINRELPISSENGIVETIHSFNGK